MKKNEIIYKIITHPLFVFPLFFIMLMASNGQVPLVDQDEAAYALIASEMVQSGDYISQNGDWIDIHKKTPLHTWLIAASIQMFGNHEFSVRFFTAFFSWGTLILIYLYGKALYYERIAMSAAIICGTCFIFPVYGKIAFTDGTLLFFQTWAGFSIMAMMQWKKKIHIVIFWIALSLGALVKGPPIIIFTGIFCILILLMHPNRKRILRLHPWFFLPLSLVPLYLWGNAYWQLDDGKTITWMYEWYIKKRAVGQVVLEGQEGFPGFYFLIFAFSFIPYFRYFLPGIWEGIKSLFLSKKHPELLMLALWMVSGWWIYEIFPSKLPSYALASLPAIAILMAHEMITLSEIRVFSTGLKALSVLEIFLTVGLVFLVYFFGRGYLEQDILWLTVAAFAFLPLASIVSFIQQWRKHFNLSIYFHLIFVGLFWLSLSFIVYPKIGKYWDGSKKVAQLIKEKAADGEMVVTIDHNMVHAPSLPYYIGRIEGKEFNVVPGWYAAYMKYSEKDIPFVGVLTPPSKDTINTFIETEHDFVYTNFLDRSEHKVGYYLILNDAAKKKEE